MMCVRSPWPDRVFERAATRCLSVQAETMRNRRRRRRWSPVCKRRFIPVMFRKIAAVRNGSEVICKVKAEVAPLRRWKVAQAESPLARNRHLNCVFIN